MFLSLSEIEVDKISDTLPCTIYIIFFTMVTYILCINCCWLFEQAKTLGIPKQYSKEAQSYTSYKHLKKGAHQSHLGRQKMGWFLAD